MKTDATEKTLVEKIIELANVTIPSVTGSHAEFVDWERSQGMYPRMVAFLAQREDGAGATPRQWTQLDQVRRRDDFKALPDDQRRAVSRGIVGDEAFDAYVGWLITDA